MNNVFWIVDSDITKPILWWWRMSCGCLWLYILLWQPTTNVNYCPPLPFSSPESFILALCYLVPTPPIHEDEKDCRGDLDGSLNEIAHDGNSESIVPEISRGFVGTLCG